MAKRKSIDVKKTARRVVDLGNLPPGHVTVDDVIATNDVNAVLSEVQAKRDHIDALLVIWRGKYGIVSYRYVKATDMDVVAMCEVVKQHCIHKNWLEED